MDSRSELAVDTIRNWASVLQPNIAELREEVTNAEHVLQLVPLNPRSAGVVFRVGYYGTTGVHFGKAGDFEELDVTPRLLIEICDSVRAGKVRDAVRSMFGIELVTTTVLELPGGRRLSDRSIHPLGLLLFPLAHRHVIAYEPW